MDSLRVSPREIKKSYEGLKCIAKGLIAEGNVENAYRYVNNCAVLAQQFNWIYSDFELEEVEEKIAERLLPNSIPDYMAQEDRVVFYDDFCQTFVLAIQYIDALLKMGKRVLFVTARNNFNDNTDRFFSHIKRYKEIEVVLIKEPTVSQTIKALFDTILSYKPSSIFLHLYANSIIVPVLYALPRRITSYLINLADQTFWLGAKAIDYCIEFRPFGATVSLERRGLKREQLLMMPFYPIIDGNPFRGFPKQVENHLIVFSGGDMYKTMDKRGGYWGLIKQLLDKYPDVVFLYATKVNIDGSKKINQFIKENHFEGRFFYIGFRSDIYEVMKHCDIYFGTFPTSGSLMSQLAAINSKPILQYYYPGTPDDETEQALCINENFQISFDDIDNFFKEADCLINDPQYRQTKGMRLHHAMIQPSQFNDLLAKTLESNKSQLPVEMKAIDYKCLDDRWYDLEKQGLMNTMSYIYGILGKKYCIKYVPSLYLKKMIVTVGNRVGL